MAYTKHTWVNNGEPAISAGRLNTIETGIADAHTLAGTAQTTADSAAADAAAASTAATSALSRSNHTGTQTAITISDLTETVQDIVGAQVTAGANITVTYDDVLGTITIAGASGGVDAETVRDTVGSALVGGSNITITVDDAGDTITIAADTQIDKSEIVGEQDHDGTTGGGTRLTGYKRVRWVNPVGTAYGRPTNMAIGDSWERDATT